MMALLAELFDLALVDLDGVVYVGTDAVPGSVDAIAQSHRLGLRTAFVTNNAGRPASQVADHLRSLGIDVQNEDVVTSAMAAADLLAHRLPAGSAIGIVGGAGVSASVEAAGLRAVAPSSPEVVAILMGFGPDISWRDLAEASYAVAAGALFVATNTDRTFPTPEGIAPGSGAFVAAVQEASGVTPLVAGKPEPTLYRNAINRFQSKNALVIGDRLDTDIAGAVNAGLTSLLVLSGICSAKQAVLASVGQRPDLIAADLQGLVTEQVFIRDIANSGQRWEHRGWSAHVEDSVVVVTPPAQDHGPSADGVDGVRCAAAAAWAQEDQVVDVVGLDR
ncbi:MAG: HAD-IIA family hydrolase [Actinobacteria bacterium]|nr:HAD-IIA family hydrolase [Actinomycetota bacterium]